MAPAATTEAAAPAIMACGWCTTWCHGAVPGGVIGLGKPLGPNGPARFATARRWASPAGERSASILSNCSRNPGNSTATGAAPANSADVSSRRLRSPQTSHCSMCRLIRLRISTRQLPVPAGQHGVQVSAGGAAGARDDQRAERPLQLAARPRQQRVGVVARHPERSGELVAVKLMDQAQLDDIPLARVQPVDGGPDQLLEFGPFRRGTDLGGLGRHVSGLLEAREGLLGPQPAEAFVARDRIEPGAQLVRIAQIPELGGRDEERILHRVGGIGRFPQDGTAIRVERHGVPVVRLGKPGGVTSHDGGDNLGVLHAAIP